MPTATSRQQNRTTAVDTDLEKMIKQAVEQPGVADAIAVYESWCKLQVSVCALQALQNPQPATTVTASSQPVAG